MNTSVGGGSAVVGGEGGRVACKVPELQKAVHISLAGKRPPGKELSHKTKKKKIYFLLETESHAFSEQTYSRPTLPWGDKGE